MAEECFQCGARCHPKEIICDKCATELTRELDDIRTLYAFLTVKLDAQVRQGPRGGGHATPAIAPTPINFTIYELLNSRTLGDGVDITILSYARDLGLDWQNTTSQLCQLIRDAPNLKTSANTMFYAPFIRKIVRKCRQNTTPPPPPRQFVGYCMNPVCQREISLVVNEHDTTITCPTCGSTWNRNALQEHNLELLETKMLDDPRNTGTPAQLSKRFEALTGQRLPATTIRTWHERCHLTPISTDGRTKTYQIIDIWKTYQQQHQKGKQ